MYDNSSIQLWYSWFSTFYVEIVENQRELISRTTAELQSQMYYSKDFRLCVIVCYAHYILLKIYYHENAQHNL